MFKQICHLIFITFLSTLLFACGGGGGGGTPADDGGGGQPPAAAATPSLNFAQSKVFRFSWVDESDATYYRLLENPDGTSGFTQVGGDIAQGAQTLDHIVPLYARVNAQYILQSCNATGCTDSAALAVSNNLVAAIGYFKASNTDADDEFGYTLSLSADGNTLAVGATGEDSNGVNEADDSVVSSGAVYVFIRSEGLWSQQAYLKASNAGAGDAFGSALSLSADGNTLAVGVWSEDSNATGVDNSQTNNLALDSGAVYVFTRSGGSTWAQQAYIKASNADSFDYFGSTLSLSADGNTLAVGAYREDSNATDVGNSQTNSSAFDSGAVYVFTRSSGDWTQQAYVKASNTGLTDRFGRALSLSADGNTLAVGAQYEASNATGIDNDQTNNSAFGSGAVYVFTRSSGDWTQQAYVKASNTGAGDEFGRALSLSGDGNTLAVGANQENSNATGVDGDQADNSVSNSGAVYVFTRNSGTWVQQAYLKASNTEADNYFGSNLSLSSDGNTLAVGANLESSNAAGVGGDQGGNMAEESGAVYVFTRSSGIWSQQAYVKASNTEANDLFGTALSLSADGNTLAVGAWGEDSNASGVDDGSSDQADNSASKSGAVYLY